MEPPAPSQGVRQGAAPLAPAGPGREEPGPVLRATSLRKGFRMGEQELEILHGIDLTLKTGELVALVGASGAGKSTLLQILGLLDRPDEGKVHVQGVDAWSQSRQTRAEIRNRDIGFVFQFYHLLPELTALENVMVPAMISNSVLGYTRRKKELRQRATGLLERFGMRDRLRHRPPQLSGGERQRVAMARALFNDPGILLADEPTGNLDSATGERILQLLFEEQRRRQLSMIIVTHDERIARQCQRILYMEDGLIQHDSRDVVPI